MDKRCDKQLKICKTKLKNTFADVAEFSPEASRIKPIDF